MNCQEAIERLPWWLNGSLESVERREVEEHLQGCTPCREALAETRLAWEIYAQHIPSETLVAFAYDDRPEGFDPVLLERHLTECPQCAAELEMVRSSRLLGEHDEIAVMPQRGAAPLQRPARVRGWQAAALAASFTSLIAIGGWVTSLQQAHQMARGPQSHGGGAAPAILAATNLADLTAADTTVRSTSPTRQAATICSPGMGSETLALHPGPKDTYREHTVKIRQEQGEILGSMALRPRDPLYDYSVIVDCKSLTPGDYTIELYGTDSGTPSRIDTFLFTVNP
jgi:anti-sigma factor RsiW